MNKEKTLSPTLEKIENLLLSTINLLGPAGSVLSSAVSNYLTTKRINFIKNTLQVFSEHLDKINTDVIDLEMRLKSDEFIHLLIIMIEKTQDEHRIEKREYLAVMFANFTVQINFEFEKFKHFVVLLDEIDELHISILQMLNEKGVQEKDDSDWMAFKIINENIETRFIENTQGDLLLPALQKLAFFGIVKTKGYDFLLSKINPVGLWRRSGYSLTILGKEFVNYLSR